MNHEQIREFYDSLLFEIKHKIISKYNYEIDVLKYFLSKNELNMILFIDMNNYLKNSQLTVLMFYKNSYDLAKFINKKDESFVCIGSLRKLIDIIIHWQKNKRFSSHIKLLQESEFIKFNYKKLYKKCLFKERRNCMDLKSPCPCESNLSYNEMKEMQQLKAIKNNY